MARGAVAKKTLIDKLIAATGSDYVGEFSNKYYFWSKENGERIQVCVSLTCPKNPVGEVTTAVTGDGFDFSAPPVVAPVSAEVDEITTEEKDALAELMTRLGL